MAAKQTDEGHVADRRLIGKKAEGQRFASPRFTLVHYGSIAVGGPHPSASQPPSPSGKAFL